MLSTHARVLEALGGARGLFLEREEAAKQQHFRGSLQAQQEELQARQAEQLAKTTKLFEMLLQATEVVQAHGSKRDA